VEETPRALSAPELVPGPAPESATAPELGGALIDPAEVSLVRAVR
jgi:hypothetical protein